MAHFLKKKYSLYQMTEKEAHTFQSGSTSQSTINLIKPNGCYNPT